MEKRILLSVVVAGLLVLGITGACLAGIEPSPWQPEINKLHSIELNLTLIQMGLDNLLISPSLPRGIKAGMSTIKYQLSVLDTQLAEVLQELYPYDKLDVLGKRGVFFALEGIRMNALGMEDPYDIIQSRMGVEPAPWKEILDSISIRINNYLKTCTPGTSDNLCPSH
jgi:hypothetical protein